MAIRIILICLLILNVGITVNAEQGLRTEHVVPIAPIPPKGPSGPAWLTQAEEMEAVEFIQLDSPDKIPHLKLLKHDNSNEYYQILGHSLKEKRQLEYIKIKDPAHFERLKKERELERQSHDLARQCRELKDKQKQTKLQKEMRLLLDQLFELREERKKNEIQNLENELNRMKEINQKRRQNKETIIQRHLEELCDSAEAFAW